VLARVKGEQRLSYPPTTCLRFGFVQLEGMVSWGQRSLLQEQIVVEKCNLVMLFGVLKEVGSEAN